MILFLYGEDTFRSRKKLLELKDKFYKEVDKNGLGLTTLNAEAVGMDKINQAISSSSLLTQKRMVIIDGLFFNKNKNIFVNLHNYLKKKQVKQDDIILIFWDSITSQEKRTTKEKKQLLNFLAKQKYAQEFSFLSNTKVAAWIVKEAELRGGKITRQGASELAALLGSDLWQISNEIDKLIHYKAGQQLQLSKGDESVEIEASDVGKLVHGTFDERIFALTDAISNKNKKLAVKLFEEQLEAGNTDDYLLNMIVRQFRILLRIRQALDSGFGARKITTSLKLHPFVTQKGITQVRNFNVAKLKGLLSSLTRIDYLMKSGKINLRAALSSLIVRL